MRIFKRIVRRAVVEIVGLVWAVLVFPFIFIERLKTGREVIIFSSWDEEVDYWLRSKGF